MQAMSQGMISARLAAQPLHGRMYGLLFVLVKPVVDLDAHGAVPVRTRLRFVPAMCPEVVRPGVALLASEPLVEGVGSALSTFFKDLSVRHLDRSSTGFQPGRPDAQAVRAFEPHGRLLRTVTRLVPAVLRQPPCVHAMQTIHVIRA